MGVLIPMHIPPVPTRLCGIKKERKYRKLGRRCGNIVAKIWEKLEGRNWRVDLIKMCYIHM